MKIGFYLKWPKGQFFKNGCNVIGDELYGESMCSVLLNSECVESAEVFAPNHLPKEKLDIMIYLNDTPPNTKWAKKHLLYLQNAYGEGSESVLENFQNAHYDGYAFISYKLLKIHENNGFNGIFLPFGVDLNNFYPREKKEIYEFDVAYVGNDIKGKIRTEKFLLPAINFNFGLYGNWQNPDRLTKDKLKLWKAKEKIPEYKKIFFSLSRGKIAQEEIPFLYSSAKINLNCTHQDCVDWDVITLRTFEVLACCGFLISDRVNIAEKKLSACIVITEGGEDLISKIEYYLYHPEERNRIAQKGFDYTTRFASIESRMTELLNYLHDLQ